MPSTPVSVSTDSNIASKLDCSCLYIYVDNEWRTSDGDIIMVPSSVVDIPNPIPEGQTLVLNSLNGKVTAIHDSSIKDDYLCEVCGRLIWCKIR